jgi:hypothetical protein
MIRAKSVTVVLYVIVYLYIIIIIVCFFLFLTGVELQHILFIRDRQTSW